jgi:hypothetical protein
MRHRIGMILAAIMNGVLVFAGAWGYLRLLRFPVPAGQLGCGQAPALVSVTVARPRAFYPCGPMFLQHRRRCVSTIRLRASLTILAGVVLIAAEGGAS